MKEAHIYAGTELDETKELGYENCWRGEGRGKVRRIGTPNTSFGINQ